VYSVMLKTPGSGRAFFFYRWVKTGSELTAIFDKLLPGNYQLYIRSFIRA
jgi:hypothetical protein